jgi:hypothetical protein
MSQQPLSLVVDHHTYPISITTTEESQILSAEEAHLAPLLPALSAAYPTGPVATLCDALVELDKTGYFDGMLYGHTIIRLFAAEQRHFYEWPAVVEGLFGGKDGVGPLMVFVVYGEGGERRKVVVWVRDDGLGGRTPEEMLRGLFRGLAQVRGWMRKGCRVEVQWGVGEEG